MGFFSSIGNAFKSVGSTIGKGVGSIVNVVHKIPVVGQAVGLAEKAVGVGQSLASKAVDTVGTVGQAGLTNATNISKIATGATGALATQVPKVISGAGSAVTSVEGAVTKTAPVIIGGVGKAVDGAGSAIQGIGSIGAYLPYIALAGGALYVFGSRRGQ